MIKADAVIPAISQNVDPTSGSGTKLAMTKWGTFDVDPVTLQSNVPWIFAGGDAVLGPQTVAKAVHQGRVAALSIQRFIEGRDMKEGREGEEQTSES